MSAVNQVTNPYDGSVVGEVPFTNWESIDAWLENAARLHSDKSSAIPKHERMSILTKAAELLEVRSEEFAMLIASEGGKPLVDARVEVARAIDGVKLCAKEIGAIHGSEVPMDLTAAGAGKTAYTIMEPIGVVAAISAFNHPLNLIVHQVGPAVAAGCPVIVKPTDATPLCCKAFVEILHEAGLPEEWCRYAICDRNVAEQMATDSRVAFFSFIGSARVGWMLKSKLAPGTRCALEHGGVAPVIVDETTNLDAMIPKLVKGGFYHSGQVCVSVQRVYVPNSMAREVAERIAEQASKLVVGNATEEATDCGPLIKPSEVNRVDTWVKEAVIEGAELLCGGAKVGDTCYQPTVLLNPTDEAKVSTQEIFGPVVAVYGYENLNEVIERANALPFSFQAAVFTQNLTVMQKVTTEINASAVMVNDHTAFRVDWMPFAGRKHSGYGVGGIGHTMRDMLEEKMVVVS